MKPYLHGLISVKKFGGKVEDYQEIHDWFDQTKAHVPDMRHRAILHNSFGIYLCEQVFGATMKNSSGKVVSVRDIGEQHVLDDLGTIPTLQDYLTHMPMLDWLGGSKRPKGVKADEVEAPALGKGIGPTVAPQQDQSGPAKDIDWAKVLGEAAKAREDWDKMQRGYRGGGLGGYIGTPDPRLTVID